MIFNKSENKGSFEEDKKSERPIRSVVKAISWRLVGTLDTLVISYFITQKISLAASKPTIVNLAGSMGITFDK